MDAIPRIDEKSILVIDKLDDRQNETPVNTPTPTVGFSADPSSSA
jgi:hypothetical protein